MNQYLPEIDVPENLVVAYAKEHGVWYAAFRVLEFVLTEGTSQAQVALVMNRLANQLAMAPELAAEVRTIGKDVATMPPIRFALLQRYACADHDSIDAIAS